MKSLRLTDLLFWLLSGLAVAIVIAVGFNLYRLTSLVDQRTAAAAAAQTALQQQTLRTRELQTERDRIRADLAAQNATFRELSRTMERSISDQLAALEVRRTAFAKQADAAEAAHLRLIANKANAFFVKNSTLDDHLTSERDYYRSQVNTIAAEETILRDNLTRITAYNAKIQAIYFRIEG